MTNIASSDRTSGDNRENENNDKEHNEDMAEGRKMRNALNNMRAHNALVAGAQWSREHHGKHLDLSDVETKKGIILDEGINQAASDYVVKRFTASTWQRVMSAIVGAIFLGYIIGRPIGESELSGVMGVIVALLIVAGVFYFSPRNR